MKFKKRIALCALMLALVAVLSFTLVACNGSLEQQIRDLQDKVNGFEQDFAEKSITVYIGEKEFAVTTRKSFLHDVLKDLKAGGKISAYAYSGGELSPFFTRIDDLEQDTANYKYYTVWHTVDEFSLKSVYAGFMAGRGEKLTEGEDEYATVFVATSYKQRTMFYSNVGVGLLPVVDGAAYAVLVD